MLLAIETSARPGSVALFSSEGLVDSRTIDGDHSGGLASAIESITGGRFDSISHFAIGIGPGSFTGLRMGLALLKGIALVHDRPTIPISSLEVIATQASEEWDRASGFVAAVLDARQDEVYAALYHLESGKLAPVESLPEGLYTSARVAEILATLDPIRIVGDGSALVAPSGLSTASVEAGRASAQTVGRLAWPLAEAGEGVEVLHLEPTYHQRPAAERKRKPRST